MHAVVCAADREHRHDREGVEQSGKPGARRLNGPGHRHQCCARDERNNGRVDVDPATQPWFAEELLDAFRSQDDARGQDESVLFDPNAVDSPQTITVTVNTAPVPNSVTTYITPVGGGLPVAIVNPEIVERSEETDVDDEGCLSIQGVLLPVERPATIAIEGRDEHGAEVRYELEEPYSRVAQHETDHLDGVLILDRTTPEAKREALASLRPRIVIG